MLEKFTKIRVHGFTGLQVAGPTSPEILNARSGFSPVPNPRLRPPMRSKGADRERPVRTDWHTGAFLCVVLTLFEIITFLRFIEIYFFEIFVRFSLEIEVQARWEAWIIQNSRKVVRIAVIFAWDFHPTILKRSFLNQNITFFGVLVPLLKLWFIWLVRSTYRPQTGSPVRKKGPDQVQTGPVRFLNIAKPQRFWPSTPHAIMFWSLQIILLFAHIGPIFFCSIFDIWKRGVDNNGLDNNGYVLIIMHLFWCRTTFGVLHPWNYRSVYPPLPDCVVFVHIHGMIIVCELCRAVGHKWKITERMQR